MRRDRVVKGSKLSQTTTEIDQGSKIYRYNQYATQDGPWRIFIPYEWRKLLPTSLKFQFRPRISQIGKSILVLICILVILKPGLIQGLKMIQEATPRGRRDQLTCSSYTTWRVGSKLVNGLIIKKSKTFHRTLAQGGRW
jgi:hypothetical protein